jgi:hypothetical protein
MEALAEKHLAPELLKEKRVMAAGIVGIPTAGMDRPGGTVFAI